ncbi:MAG: aminoglycoside phosphotransferase family protein [Thermosynechococcaceae cyanobacterium MS004]|nr:aminoglycoside phosphotransferase family protein [Thermosynechococcaceae cyanobacterium MS004]
MTLVLNSENVLNYLVDCLLVSPQDSEQATVVAQEYKNFNLVVTLASGESLLVKQERLMPEQGNQCDFWREQRLYELFQHFTELNDLLALTSEVVYFDPDNFIIVLRYFSEFSNLSHFYAEDQNQDLPTVIAQNLGQALGQIHRRTWGQTAYQYFLAQGQLSDYGIERSPNFLRGLERFGPGIFKNVSTDGLDFWRLYQRYESLHKAVVEIAESYQRCCLIHSDLEFRNVLVKDSGAASRANLDSKNLNVKLIDWEFFRWGDPAYDLGIVLASYLDRWLESLVVSQAIPLQVSLQLAATPIERLQPSMTTLVKSYLTEFPQILDYQPTFLQRLTKFTGLVLLKEIQVNIERHNPFGNNGICTLQVAKMLLCSPEKSMIEIFGTSHAHLTQTGGVLLC